MSLPEHFSGCLFSVLLLTSKLCQALVNYVIQWFLRFFSGSMTLLFALMISFQSWECSLIHFSDVSSVCLFICPIIFQVDHIFVGFINCFFGFIWSKYRVIRNTQTTNPNPQLVLCWLASSCFGIQFFQGAIFPLISKSHWMAANSRFFYKLSALEDKT